jgi:hypothetical protein
MIKRILSQPPPQGKPSYPTYDEFEASRRTLLKQLGAIGAAILGAAALGGCGERRVAAEPDLDIDPIAGEGPLPDARIDSGRPDAERLSGAADQRTRDHGRPQDAGIDAVEVDGSAGAGADRGEARRDAGQ